MAGAHEEIGHLVASGQMVAEEEGIGKGIHPLRMLLLETGVDQRQRRESARESDRYCVP